MFSYAVKARLLSENAADGIKIGDETNDERKHYVDRATATAVIDNCPSMEWKLLFALSRYCGLRIPTEIQVLRSSCRTDLEDNFRETVINAWIGRSTKIGQKHYSQVRPSDWEEANRFGGSAGGSISANQGGIRNHHENQKPAKSLVLMGTDSPRCVNEYPRQGSNLRQVD